MGDQETPDTRHATALHGDVVGYSRLVADNEIETYNTLQVLRRIIDQEVDARGGTIASFVGDEFLAVLPSEDGAVTAAIEIQRKIANENNGLPDGRKMRFRLGVHAGEITNAGDRWYGDAINIAARLQALAEPGGINISREALDGAGDVPARVVSLGPQRLKNIPERVTVLKLVDESLERDDSKPWRRRIPTSSKTSLAVSPFVNYGADEDSHFADGLMMALTISLMQIPGVDVVSELSTLGYRDQSFSAQQLGHELGVRYVLEGAVQRSGSQVRVLTQLIDVDDGRTGWADRFEASLDDVFTAQDEIVSAIVAELDIEILGGEVARMYRLEISAPAVEVLYRGLQHLSRGTPAELQLAADAFEEVIALEPDSPSGFTMAAMAHNWMAMFGATDDVGGRYKIAEKRAIEAIERDDASGIGQTVLAHIRVQHHDWDGALDAVKEATNLRPSCDLTYGVAASVMRYLGRWQDAVDYAERAARLSPLFSSWYHGIRANAEFLSGNYEAAADAAEGVVAENEEDVDALLTLAAAQSALGLSRHATAAVDHARRTRPGLSSEALRDLPYRDASDLDRFIGELEAAGLD
ncbi:MAG: adenylate/guanylate cyclase domain-containing protein [Actinomycetota bacterium]